MRKSLNKGEPMVWLTAMGLTLGLVMVVGLLTLIFFNGLNVFWPKRVLQIQTHLAQGFQPQSYLGKVATDVAQQFPPMEYMGELVLTQEKRGHRIDSKDQKPKEEWQIFLGNRDQLGKSFQFIDQDRIVNTLYPKEIIKIERLEHGPALGYPLRLELKNSETIPSHQEAFRSRLEKLIQASNQRWDQIKAIEKKQIGKINRQMEEFVLAKKRIQQKSLSKKEKENLLANIAKQEKKLQAEYEVLAKQASELRKIQKENHLAIKLANGLENKIPIGQILHVYFPNQLNTWSRTGLFFHNLWAFLSQDPREANTEGGVFPALFGTLVMTVLMSLAVVPVGVLAAIYLKEYAKQGFMVRMVRIAVNNLAGVPSIVFGVFGLGFFVYMVGGTIDQLFFSDKLPTPTFGTGGLFWASLTLALLTVPVVIVSTEEALSSVSRGIREGALACGASKWQALKSVVLPACAPGVLTGAILAMARGAGEVAPLMLVGVVKLAPSLPINSIYPYLHLDQKFMHLGFHIYDLGFQSPDSEAAKPMVFATTLLLVALVLLLNLGAIILRERLRKKYASGTF